MRRIGLTTLLIASSALFAFPTAYGQSNDTMNPSYYPGAALSEIYTKEQIEEKKKQDLEEEAANKRDQYDREKRRVEAEIEAHRFQIENLKMKQERAQDELESVNADLEHVSDQLASYQDEHKKLDESAKATVDFLNSIKSGLADKQKNLDGEIDAINESRKKSEKSIFDKSMDIQRMRSEISTAESRAAEAEAKRAALEADEMKVRTDWTQTKMQLTENYRKRDAALAEMNDAKKRHDVAFKEYLDAKTELAKSEKIKNDTQKKTQGEIAKYEKEIIDSNRARIAAEAERIRVESETSKIHEYAASIRNEREKALENQSEVHGLVLKSTVALETARTELNESVSKTDQLSYKRQKEESVSRGLAAADEASKMLGGGKIWVTSSKCNAYSNPKSDKPVGFFDAGHRLLARDAGSTFVEIMNGAGSSVYLPSHCGSYEN